MVSITPEIPHILQILLANNGKKVPDQQNCKAVYDALEMNVLFVEEPMTLVWKHEFRALQQAEDESAADYLSKIEAV